MKYTRNALGLLNAQYRSVLKKCLLINLGLFALCAGVSTANAVVTLSPTLDNLKAEAQKAGAVSSEAYTLTKLNDGDTVPEGKAAVRIGKNVYYFGPKDGKFGPKDAKLLSILAGTPVASVDDATNPSTIKFDVTNIATKFPSSVFEYKTGTEDDYNFVVQEVNPDGKITKEYYKVALKTDEIGTSGAIKWSTESAGATGSMVVKLPNSDTQTLYYTVDESKIGTSEAIKWNTESNGATGSVEVKFPNYDTPTKLYYTVDESKYDPTLGTRLTDLTADVGSSTKKVLFKGLNQTSDSSSVYGGAIYNTSNGGYNIYADFIGNYVSSTSTSYGDAKGGAIYNSGKIGNVIGDFIGNHSYSLNRNVAGGAIYNDGNNASIDDIIGNFIGNYSVEPTLYSYARANGGAIYNNKGTIGSITGDFIGNYILSKSSSIENGNGGAIYNNEGIIGNITGDFIGNYAESTSPYNSGGGAIYNSGTISNIYGDFIGNYHSAYMAQGGAIYNTNIVGDILGNFINNYTFIPNLNSSGSANGGAIYNYKTIGNITGNFIGNHIFSTSQTYGGAIYNHETMGNIVGDFIGNYAESTSYNTVTKGGAIYNEGSLRNITGNFNGNYATVTSSSTNAMSYGGAIYNNKDIGNITGDFIGNYTLSTTNSSSYYYGGAIYNNKDIDDITGDFIGNYASATNSSSDADARGGAIYNNGTIGNITGDFIGNNAIASSSSEYPISNSKGGAFYNSGIIESIMGNFVGNYISSSFNSSFLSSVSKGGAIYNSKTINNIAGDFIGNYASVNNEANSDKIQAQGGAIYNEGTLTIAGASTFTDNYVEVNGNKTSNAIHNLGTINFNGTNIVVNDAITGKNGTINIASSSNGMTTFNNSVSGNTVNLKQGTLKLGHYDSALLNEKSIGTLGVGVDFNVSGDSTLSLADDDIHSVYLGNMTLNSDLKFGMDVDLANNSTDTFTTDALNDNSHKIILNHVNLTTENGRHISEFNIDNMSGLLKLDEDIKVTSGTKVNNTYLAEVINDNTIKFGNTKALETAVQFKKADKNFNMTNTAEIEVDLGKLVGPELSINGNNNVINGNNKKGMTIASGQTVSLNDVSVKGFSGAFAENNGTMNIAASEGKELNLDSGISGSGDINAKGAGKLNINSDIAANKMTVSGGELNLKSGSELANVENFVANGGVLNVGDQTVNLKKAEFNDGSTLAINIKSDGNGLLKADSLTVNGGNLKATLGQGVVDMQNQQKTVTLLESGTEFVNKFADVADNNMYRFEKADKAGDYIISLARTAEDVSQENGGTQNNAETAKGWVDGSKFEQGSVSADVADKLADLAQNDAKGFNEALSALAPSDTPEVRTNSVNHNTEMFRAVVSHLDDVSKKKQYGLSSGDAVDGVSVWAKAFGNHAKVDNTSKAYGFKSDGYGATLGIEKQLDNAFKVGLGYSYFYNDVDGFMRDSDVNTHTGFVYGEYRPNNWYTNAIASYGYSEYDENKHVAGDVYKAKYDVDNIGAQVMTGYNASVAKVDVTPEAGLRYNNIHRDNYVDSAGQAVKAETMDVMTAVAGLKVGKDLVSCFGLHEVYWRPEARLAATYDLISDKENAVVSLSNGSGYVVKGQRLNRFGVETGAGVTFYLSPDVESSVGYEGKFRSHYQDHTGYVSAKYKF